MADYCVYWFRKAHDHLPACTAERPRGGSGGTGRHAKHPQQPVARGRTGSHRRRPARSSRPWITSPGRARPMSTSPSSIGSRRKTRSCCPKSDGSGSRSIRLLARRRPVNAATDRPVRNMNWIRGSAGSSIRRSQTRRMWCRPAFFKPTCVRSDAFKGSSQATTASCFPSKIDRIFLDSDPNSRSVVKPYLVGRRTCSLAPGARPGSSSTSTP